MTEQKDLFLKKEKHLSNFDINKLITQLKKQPDTIWLKDIDDWCLKHAAEDLSNAYQQFFDSIKGKRRGKKQELPKFKKKSNQQSYRTRGIKLSDKGLKLPKIKTHININLHQEIIGKIKSATISKTPGGKYFVSILVETEVALQPMAGREVGIDMGLKDLMILSNGIKFKRPEQILVKAKRELKKQQKKLSRKTKGSKNYEAKRIQVAKNYELITAVNYHDLKDVASFFIAVG